MGVDDFMPEIFWTKYFIAVQGYNVKDNCLHQDNKSSILMENNGKAPSRNQTKHINTQYIFITNRVKKSEVSVVWCPAGDMLRDYMNKPIQGDMFRKFRDKIMRVIPAAYPCAGKVKVEQLRKV